MIVWWNLQLVVMPAEFLHLGIQSCLEGKLKVLWSEKMKKIEYEDYFNNCLSDNNDFD